MLAFFMAEYQWTQFSYKQFSDKQHHINQYHFPCRSQRPQANICMPLFRQRVLYVIAFYTAELFFIFNCL